MRYWRTADLKDSLQNIGDQVCNLNPLKVLLAELTGKRYGDLPATVFLDIDVLTECLRNDYRERLTERDIEKIHKDLRLYTKIGFNSYKWCIETAEKILKVPKEDES